MNFLECLFVFHYVPSVIHPDLKYRIQKAVVKVDVLSSLDISTIITPSQVVPNEFNMLVNIKNTTNFPITINRYAHMYYTHARACLLHTLKKSFFIRIFFLYLFYLFLVYKLSVIIGVRMNWIKRRMR